MAIHLTPEVFNKACSLMFIRSIENRPPNVRSNIHLKGALREFNYYIGMGEKFLQLLRSEGKYFSIERDSSGISIIPKPGGLGILITPDNHHLMDQYVKHSPKPTSIKEWRRIFGE